MSYKWKYFQPKIIAWYFMIIIAKDVKKLLYMYFDVGYKFKINRPKYLFLWCLFFSDKWVQKRVYGNAKEFFPCDFMKASQTNHYYTTCVQLYQKVTPTQVFSYEFCKIFKNTYFVKHFWTAASERLWCNEVQPYRCSIKMW